MLSANASQSTIRSYFMKFSKLGSSPRYSITCRTARRNASSAKRVFLSFPRSPRECWRVLRSTFGKSLGFFACSFTAGPQASNGEGLLFMWIVFLVISFGPSATGVRLLAITHYHRCRSSRVRLIQTPSVGR